MKSMSNLALNNFTHRYLLTKNFSYLVSLLDGGAITGCNQLRKRSMKYFPGSQTLQGLGLVIQIEITYIKIKFLV